MSVQIMSDGIVCAVLILLIWTSKTITKTIKVWTWKLYPMTLATSSTTGPTISMYPIFKEPGLATLKSQGRFDKYLITATMTSIKVPPMSSYPKLSTNPIASSSSTTSKVPGPKSINLLPRAELIHSIQSTSFLLFNTLPFLSLNSSDRPCKLM